MKNSLLSLYFILIISSLSLKAQDSKIGLRAGLNLVNFSGTDAEIFTDKNRGYFVGFYYDYIYTDKIGIETGFDYANTKSSDDSDSSAITLGYIDIPVLFKYYLRPNINLQVGPQLSLYTNSSFENKNLDNLELFKTARGAAVFGAEYQTNFNLSIQMKYKLGFSTIIEPQLNFNSLEEVETKFDIKYNAFQVGIGYLF